MVQMRTRKFAFEIYWPLWETWNGNLVHSLLCRCRYFGTFHLAQCTHSISVIGARFSEKNNDGAWQQKVGGASGFENT